MLTTANEGKAVLLSWLLTNATRTDFSMKLFSNDVTVDPDIELADLTQASFTGYVAKTLSRASFAAPSLGGYSATSSYAAQTWTNSGGTTATVYGVYITNAAGTTLFWAENFSPVASILAAGTLTYTPTFWLNGGGL